MFSLDRTKNDTSLSLDLLRAVAAQMVCVGHALNFGGLYYTEAPSVGVLLFFILSGFVIAHTLCSKTSGGDYGLGRYMVERFSRIYCGYLPALILFAAIEYGLRWIGAGSPNSGPITLSNFIRNLAMLQNYPGSIGGTQFGLSGQTTTVAIEFHIYFFVGSLYFLCIGRHRWLAVVVAIISARLPLAHFLSLQGRGLFILWLAGFATYFVIRSIKIDGVFVGTLALATAGIIYFWFPFADLTDVYDIANYPILSLCFVLLVAITQLTWLLARTPWAARLIHFFASYSFTLFLVHLILIRSIYLIWPDHGWSGFLIGVAGANVFSAALAFSPMGEIHYKRMAERISGLFRWRPSIAPFPAE